MAVISGEERRIIPFLLPTGDPCPTNAVQVGNLALADVLRHMPGIFRKGTRDKYRRAVFVEIAFATWSRHWRSQEMSPDFLATLSLPHIPGRGSSRWATARSKNVGRRSIECNLAFAGGQLPRK